MSAERAILIDILRLSNGAGRIPGAVLHLMSSEDLRGLCIHELVRPLMRHRLYRAGSATLVTADHYESMTSVVAVSLYANPLTQGHVRLIQAASKLGDRLVAIVNNDEQARLKGAQVVIPLAERVEIVRAIAGVHLVVPSIDTDRSVCNTLRIVRPQKFANGGDATLDNIRERSVCEELGITMLFGVGGGKDGHAGRDIRRDTPVP